MPSHSTRPRARARVTPPGPIIARMKSEVLGSAAMSTVITSASQTLQLRLLEAANFDDDCTAHFQVLDGVRSRILLRHLVWATGQPGFLLWVHTLVGGHPLECDAERLDAWLYAASWYCCLHGIGCWRWHRREQADGCIEYVLPRDEPCTIPPLDASR